MDLTPTPSPRRGARRADRYRQESGVAPSSELMARTAPAAPRQPIPPAPTAVPVPAALRPRPEQVRQEAPPPAMARPKAPPRRVDKPDRRMPRWLFASIVGMAFILLTLFTAQSLMQAYLIRQQQAREAAYQRVLENHPLLYRDWIEHYAAENNLQPAFVAAIIMNESSFRKDAESNVGARGLMQMMPDTAEWIAGKLDMDNYAFGHMFDPETNIRFGCWYLGYLSRLFRGDPVTVASAYHAGQGEVTGWLSDRRMSPDGVALNLDSMMDGPTKTYAGRVTKAYGIYDALYFTQADETGSGADDGADDDPA